MNRFRVIWILITTAAFGCSSNTTNDEVKMLVSNNHVATETASGPRYPHLLTQYDIMSDNDIFYMHFLQPAIDGESVSDWPIVKAITKISTDLIDSDIVSSHLNEAFPASSQVEFSEIQSQIEECATILNVEPPQLFIKQSPEVNAYVTKLSAPHYLVITSGLYNLYRNKPREMRFIIGHELGHLKCKHLEAHAVARCFVEALAKGGGRRVKKTYVAPILIGQLLRWKRAGEISADRAGLICLGAEDEASLEMAQQALLRLLHGTEKNADLDQYVRDVLEIEESEPFVKLRRKIQSRGSTHPFISDRCLALREWHAKRGYQNALERNSQYLARVIIDEVLVSGLPESDTGAFGTEKCDPYVVVSNGNYRHKSKVFENTDSPRVENVLWQFPYHDNLRLMFEVRDYDGTNSDDLVGGLTVQFHESKTETKPKNIRLYIPSDANKRIPTELAVKYHLEFDDR